MKTNHQLVILLLALTIFSITAKAQQNAVSGKWTGEIELPGAKLEIVFNISEDENGNLITKLDVPQQGASNVPVKRTSITNDSLLLQVPTIMSTYQGQFITPDSITGYWVQGGQKMVCVRKWFHRGLVHPSRLLIPPPDSFSHLSELLRFR